MGPASRVGLAQFEPPFVDDTNPTFRAQVEAVQFAECLAFLRGKYNRWSLDRRDSLVGTSTFGSVIIGPPPGVGQRDRINRQLRSSERQAAILNTASFQQIRSTQCAREGPGSKGSPKYWVSRATFPCRNSMMLTV